LFGVNQTAEEGPESGTTRSGLFPSSFALLDGVWWQILGKTKKYVEDSTTAVADAILVISSQLTDLLTLQSHDLKLLTNRINAIRAVPLLPPSPSPSPLCLF
jgi:hypothetical protein